MTPHQKIMVESLQWVTFLPGCHDKRFSRDLMQLRDRDLTPRQDENLRRIVKRYRRQITPKVVALAEDAG